MKKFKANLAQFMDRLNEEFRSLSLRRQRQYTIYYFIGYLLLTIAVIGNVWYDIRSSTKVSNTKDVDNGVLKINKYSRRLNDSVLTIKKLDYERE